MTTPDLTPQQRIENLRTSEASILARRQEARDTSDRLEQVMQQRRLTDSEYFFLRDADSTIVRTDIALCAVRQQVAQLEYDLESA